MAAGRPQAPDPGNNLTQQVCTARGVLLLMKLVRKKKGKILDGATGKCSSNVAEWNPGVFRCEHFKASCLCCCESCQTSLALFGEQVIASCSQLASKDHPKVSQDSQSLSLQTGKKGRGTRSDKVSASKQWILGVDQSYLQVFAKNFLLEISIPCAGSPAACPWDAPDAIQVHPASPSVKQARPQHICSVWARKSPIAPLAWASKVDSLRSIPVTPFQMFTGRSFASKATLLILGKNLWWHPSPESLQITQGVIPGMAGVHEASIHCTARKSIAPDIAQPLQVLQDPFFPVVQTNIQYWETYGF